MERLNAMLDPKTVALVGAREKEGSIGRALLDNLVRSGKQKVFPVNPGTGELLGRPCYPTIDSVPQKIDLAVVAVRAELVPGIVEECGGLGVKGVLIISSGFGEAGEQGELLERRLKACRDRFGMTILGPGSLGIIRPPVGLNATFLKLDPGPGNIAFISQTGELGQAMLEWACDAHLGFSLFVSLGRAVDIDFGDLIDFVGDDYPTKSILLDMERITRAKNFMSAARGFARTKPIIVVKPGRLEFPRRRTDPPKEMGDDVYTAAFKRVGLVRVKEAADLFNAAQVLDAAYLPRGPRLAIITNGSTVGLMAKDVLLEQGGEPAQLSDESVHELNGILPHWNRENPIALPIEADSKHYEAAIRACIRDPAIDGLLVIHLPRASTTAKELASTIITLAKGAAKPVLAAMMGGNESREGARLLIQNNIPAYGTPEEAVRTYLYMYHYKRSLELLYETPEELPVDQAPPRYHLKTLIRHKAHEGVTSLTAEQALDVLASYGIPTQPVYTVADRQHALRKAQELGYPVVLKLETEPFGGREGQRIVLGVASEDGLRSAFDTLKGPTEGEAAEQPRMITVQKMLWDVEHQLILRVWRHEDFGPVIQFGTGGMGYDLFHDFAIGLAPLNQMLARRLIEETKVYALVQGYRGRPPVDIRELERVIVSVSNLIVDFPEITSLDADPIAVVAGKIVILGASIAITATPEAGVTTPYPHLVITPYPTRYTTRWNLKDGTEITLRAIRPEDEPLEYEMLTTLSEETAREGFFSPIKDWTHDTLVRFCNIDYEREVAIVAELNREKRIIGIGRLIIQPDFRKGEFAVLVHDEFQGRGLGYKLLDTLIGVAQEKGLEEMEGIILSSNDRMLNLVKSLGFGTKLMSDGISRATLKLK